MEKHKRLAFLFLVCLIPGFAGAQQVYTSAHYGNPGDLYLYNRITDIALLEALTQNGEEVTWDISSDSALNTYVNSIVQPSQAINQFTFLVACAGLNGLNPLECNAIWNATHQALLSNESLFLFQFSLDNLQRYYRKTPDLLLENFFGFTVDLGGAPTSAVIIYDQPDTIARFPLAYGDQWTSATSFFVDLGITGQDIAYASSIYRTSAVDSWGTIVTPYATYENVIRLRSDILRSDTVTFDSIVLPVEFTQVEYLWFDTAYALPVMTAQGILVEGDTVLINSAGYIYEAVCAAPTWVAGSGAAEYFVDSTGAVTVDFSIDGSNANTYAWDFGDGQSEVTGGPVSHTYTAPGTYMVAVEGCMTNCLPLNSCSMQFFAVHVTDTITSAASPGEDRTALRVFPNPAYTVIHLSVPESAGPGRYSIYDMTGRPVAAGDVQTGHAAITIDQWPTGVYMVKFIEKGRSAKMMTRRIMVIK